MFLFKKKKQTPVDYTPKPISTTEAKPSRWTSMLKDSTSFFGFSKNEEEKVVVPEPSARPVREVKIAKPLPSQPVMKAPKMVSAAEVKKP